MKDGIVESNMKRCAKCEFNKSLDDFGISNYNKPSGRQSWCKSCRSEYSKTYMSKVMILPAKFSKYAHQLTINEKPTKIGLNDLGCACYYCKKLFLPRLVDVIERIRALKQQLKTKSGEVSGAENNLYCSQICKNLCSTYKQRVQHKFQIPLARRVRCNQHIDKQALLNIQLDQYNYNFCEKCGTQTNELYIHHNLMVSKHPMEADNIAHQILVCSTCHTHEGC